MTYRRKDIKEQAVQIIDISGSSPAPVLPAKRLRSASIIIISSDDDGDLLPHEQTRTKARHQGGLNKRSRRRSSSVVILSESDGSIKLAPLRRKRKPAVAVSTDQSAPEPLQQDVTEIADRVFHYPPTSLQLLQTFPTLNEAIKAVLNDAEARQIVMRKGQRFDDDQGVKKVTIRCQCYQKPKETHNMAVHLGDQRRGRSNRTDCKAHVNINRKPGTSEYHLTLIDDIHNHPPVLPIGGRARRAPTEVQRQLISRYANQRSFGSRHVKFVLEDQLHPERPLERCQLYNVIGAARREAREQVAALGGDAASVLRRLEELKEEDPRWRYRTTLSDNSTLTGLWWQSPEQADLLSEYPDVLINDCTYSRNQYGYPLNIGVGVDRLGHSRNLWYSLHAREDAATHEWALRNHLDHAPRPPDVFASDRDPALEAVVPRLMPTTYHIICLHHMEGNLTTNLRPSLGGDWDAFLRRFWEVYRAASPDVFESLWQQLLLDYPSAAPYLSTSLYPIKQRWAHPWISCHFTAGIRTNGRVESENRTNKILGGPKSTLLEVFENLNKRTQEQLQREQVAVRDVCIW